MPSYKTNGAVEINCVLYESGRTVDLEAGPTRNRLLEVDAIYRHDIPPHTPRGMSGDVVQLPCVEVPDGDGGTRPVLLDEWAIPDEQWPWPGPWKLYPRNMGPAKLRPIY